MGIIHNPHDKFFKTSMANLQIAKYFFQQHLPATIQTYLDFNTLELQPSLYIDKVLRSSASDILYKVNYLHATGSAYLCVLAEHQSSVDNLMPLRLWQYVLAVWNECLKKNKDVKLPLVITLVFYNGKKKYDGPQDIRELIDAPQELMEQFLLNPFYLVDVHDIQDEDLRKQHWLGLMEFAFKHSREKEILNYIQLFLELLKGVMQDAGGTDFAASVLKYFLAQAKTGDPEKLSKTIVSGLSETKEGKIMATVEQYFIEKHKNTWLETGVQQGVHQGESTLLRRQLKHKFKIIPEVYRQRIEQANAEDLLKWGEKMLDSQAIEDVFNS
jgi:predicted transposase/invertase (TIGR01784 family)